MEVTQITCAEVQGRMVADPATVLLDVRESGEWELGHIPGARHLPRSEIPGRVAEMIPDRATAIICYCAHGVRSARAVETLHGLGYHQVTHMAGGFVAWEDAQLPTVATAVLSDEERVRYQRHITLPHVGATGQVRLRQARVLLVGAGGLGSPAALYLAAAGVGTLGIVDHDIVDPSNLQRQILHTTERIGAAKIESAQVTLRGLNPLVTIEPHHVRVTQKNAQSLCETYDIILDGSDNFPTRYLLNECAVTLRKPMVHGSVYRFEGQVTVFWPGRGPCYRCLYREAPPPAMAPSCAEAGVLGVLPGVIGLLQAVETIKLILACGESLVGRLICYEALQARFHELQVPRDPACPTCKGLLQERSGDRCSPPATIRGRSPR
ncbi:MAG: molybdopterin-synthase adenylyltransferase MoeB [Deltaproteobacteria bacterium]|nr:molybdopterin-synthase adenylyltransferase MoeB [Deltaproteobacteria bacterium]